MAGADENDTIGTEVTTLKSLDSTEWAEIEDTLKRAAEEQKKDWAGIYHPWTGSERDHSSFTSEISHGGAVSESMATTLFPFRNGACETQTTAKHQPGFVEQYPLISRDMRLEIEDRESNVSGSTSTPEPRSISSKPAVVIRKPRTFSDAKSSSYCHTCGGKKRLIHCSNVISGSCRKSICSSCFGRHGWELPNGYLTW
eukprot:CAMPEP_0184679486 /NCGR_PEP_ID=MMETSP0312-20130426/2322_1 /TAXON_ID=31354 /ORGANISM="Compsopogon coeruleus, Strain SAG 36.94" /LENGTH=198 /DNA_ID=CAMNT_0027128965 /DNA_START=145 /DNA_END=738 /DNA_ORIENTATION=+